MRYKRVIVVTAVGFAAGSVFGAYQGGYLSGGVGGNYSVAEGRSFREFPLFYAGDSVNGHKLDAVLRDPLGPNRRNQVSVGFIYGTCEASSDSGCAPPVEVSNEPACSRALAMYGQGPGSPVPRPTNIRGATGSFFEGGSRLELQTGTTTVVIFARSRREALSVAKSLRGVNVPVSPTDLLPLPAPGALKGEVPCPR
jgi:hypothetical protein